MENPWLQLPTEPPYVLPADRDYVEKFNRALRISQQKHYLQINAILPEPFIGAKDAPVLLLSNNPGIGGDDSPSRQAPAFREVMRNNLLHASSDWPFLYLNPTFDSWETWWRRKRLRRIIKRFGQQTVARCILNVVLCPYPSQFYKPLFVPSQSYSFKLVHDAVARNAVIILFRPGQQSIWEENVPSLKGYERFFSVPNAQNPAITENCPGYDLVVEALEASTSRNQDSEVKQRDLSQPSNQM